MLIPQCTGRKYSGNGGGTMDRRSALTKLGLSALAGGMLVGCGRDNEPQQVGGQTDGMLPEPSSDDGLVELLFVQNAFGMKFDGSQLTLIDVDPKTLFFADRPDDIAGFLTFNDFIKLVSEGPDSFKDDPPNASFMIFGEDTIDQVVVKLTARPVVEGSNMIYPSVEVIEGQLRAEGGANTLFIDVIGRPISPTSVAGVHRRHRRRRAVRSPGPL
jgi:hypothetical protein